MQGTLAESPTVSFSLMCKCSSSVSEPHIEEQTSFAANYNPSMCVLMSNRQPESVSLLSASTVKQQQGERCTRDCRRKRNTIEQEANRDDLRLKTQPLCPNQVPAVKHRAAERGDYNYINLIINVLIEGNQWSQNTKLNSHKEVDMMATDVKLWPRKRELLQMEHL